MTLTDASVTDPATPTAAAPTIHDRLLDLMVDGDAPAQCRDLAADVDAELRRASYGIGRLRDLADPVREAWTAIADGRNGIVRAQSNDLYDALGALSTQLHRLRTLR